MFKKIIFLSGIVSFLSSCVGNNYSKTDTFLENYQMNVCNNLKSSFYQDKSKLFYAIEITNSIGANNKLFYKKGFAISLDNNCKLNEKDSTVFEVGDLSINNVNQSPIILSQGFGSAFLNLISVDTNLKGYYVTNSTNSTTILRYEDGALSNNLNLKSINCDIQLDSVSKCILNAGSMIETKYITFDNVTYPDYHLLFVEKGNNSVVTKQLGVRGNIILKIDNGKNMVAYLSTSDAEMLSKFDISKTNVYLVYSRYSTSFQNDSLYLINFNHSMVIPTFTK